MAGAHSQAAGPAECRGGSRSHQEPLHSEADTHTSGGAEAADVGAGGAGFAGAGGAVVGAGGAFVGAAGAVVGAAGAECDGVPAGAKLQYSIGLCYDDRMPMVALKWPVEEERCTTSLNTHTCKANVQLMPILVYIYTPANTNVGVLLYSS